MSWFSASLLPAPLIIVEIWLVRLFLLLSVLAIGPILLFFIYDFLLYIWRTATYEIPIIGGRARGKRRPRAPSLKKTVPTKRIMAMVGGHEDQPSTDDEGATSTAVQTHIPSLSRRTDRVAGSTQDD